jgi:hypothetical protein
MDAEVLDTVSWNVGADWEKLTEDAPRLFEAAEEQWEVLRSFKSVQSELPAMRFIQCHLCRCI